MFEKATRLKLRFETTRWTISVEDLWDLSLTDLDAVAISLHKLLRQADGTVSFVTPVAPSNDVLQLKFDIVKHVLDLRVKERDEAKMANERANKKQQLLEILSRKENAALEGKSSEELTAMINSL